MTKIDMTPVARRHLHEDGWEYYDHPTGEDCAGCETLFTAAQLAQVRADALEEAAQVCITEHSRLDYDDADAAQAGEFVAVACSDAIRALKEKQQ